jgi:3'-phosphoadenosine 5'-phosphosulfate sulfotransferase (PAPS reductase)/FAD synthetase
MTDGVRHICGISGGKDSSALAVYLHQTRPELDLEYFFCDTGAELPETYEYLSKLEAVLGKPIARLNSDRGFDHWFEVYRGTLPSPQMRWCTRVMKIKPLEEWVGEDQAISYVAIRADESNRKGYVSTKLNIKAVFPFVEDGIAHADVLQILDNAGIGLPSYYEWRTRSGCYFCFYQRKAEWVGLADRHPDLFEKAMAIEQKVLTDAGVYGDKSYENFAMQGRVFTWSSGETLGELVRRRGEIMDRHQGVIGRVGTQMGHPLPLAQVLDEALDVDDDMTPCTICAI